MVNGDSIQSKIIKIDIDKISFHKANNLTGPLYVISKNEVSKIVFENGAIETLGQEKVELTLEEVKEIIIETINNSCYSYQSGKNYKAEFEGNYLKLSPESDSPEGKFTISSYYYDFTAECNFHTLSLRNDGFSYINVVVPKLYKRSNGKIKLKSNRDKLVIKVNGHKNGKTLREALIKYNSFFVE